MVLFQEIRFVCTNNRYVQKFELTPKLESTSALPRSSLLTTFTCFLFSQFPTWIVSLVNQRRRIILYQTEIQI